ncbi:MAG: c-type cytochrome domain-containing protein [Pirellulales bacterium]|nr:c-type cytochrome domain-containing protein [Pirellulales bacterium]
MNSATAAESTPPPSFVRDIAPILLKHCVACHGLKNPAGDYQLHTWEKLTTPGASTAAPFTPGKLSDSEWLRLITHADPAQRMPLERPALSAEEIQTLKNWIVAGAAYDHANPTLHLREVAIRAPLPPAPARYPGAWPISAAAIIPVANSASNPDSAARLLTAGYRELTLWSLPAGKLLRRIGPLPERILALAISPRGNLIALAGGIPAELGVVQVYDLEHESLIAELAQGGEVFTAVSWSPDGTQLAAAGADRTVRVWRQINTMKAFPSPATQPETPAPPEKHPPAEIQFEEVWQTSPHADWVTCLAWSADGKYLLTASRDKTSRLLDAGNGNIESTFTDVEHPRGRSDFSPLAGYAWTAAEGKIHEWVGNTGELFSPKSQKDAEKIPDEAERNRSQRGNPFTIPKGEVRGSALVGENLLLAIDGEIYELNWASRRQVQRYQGASGDLLTLQHFAARDWIVGTTSTGEVLLWKPGSAEPLARFFARP